MRSPTDSLIAAVRWEGLVEDEDGEVSDDGLARLQALRDSGRYIILVSPKAQSTMGMKLLMDTVIRYGVAYDEVWACSGIPETDEWYDNNAQSL